MLATEAIDRLNQLLPLKDRQDSLPPELKKLHQEILRKLAGATGPLPLAELLSDDSGSGLPSASALNDGIRQLANLDLIIVDDRQQEVVGAYPITFEETPHQVRINQNPLYAMCALDALATAALFDAAVDIASTCHVSQAKIQISLTPEKVIQALPSEELFVGVRWQTPEGNAAHSLCLEMVFLANRTLAENWQQQAPSERDIFVLETALEFANGYFLPLLEE